MPLAQLNIAEALYPMSDPRMDGFTGRIELINQLAERSPGFVWRLQDDSDNDGALELRLPGSNDILVNMSVWADVESLYNFGYKTAHAKLIRQREDWFEIPSKPIIVLWWVEDGHIPTLEEARENLELLRTQGPSPKAFNFDIPFNAIGEPITPTYPKKDCA